MAVSHTAGRAHTTNGADWDSDSDGDHASQFLEANDWDVHPGAVAARDGDYDNTAVNSESESDNADEESWHDPPELADLIEQATAHKTAGNAHFAAQKNHAALEAYRAGLDCLPEHKEPPKKQLRSKGKGKARADLADGRDDEEDSDSDASALSDSSGRRAFRHKHDPPQKAEEGSSQLRELQDDEDEKDFVGNGQNGISEEEKQVVELRATLWSNLAATQLRLSLYTEAAKSAGEALKDKPAYVKALQRRATANEKLNTWTSLSAALEDYTTLSQLPDTPASLKPSIRLALRTLPPRIEERKGAETKEMMDKLKGLGNSFLGKFGMSTDNFQFVKNEETGGYSMNFTQTPPKK